MPKVAALARAIQMCRLPTVMVLWGSWFVADLRQLLKSGVPLEVQLYHRTCSGWLLAIPLPPIKGDDILGKSEHQHGQQVVRISRHWRIRNRHTFIPHVPNSDRSRSSMLREDKTI
jgi:hypothetical protein